MNGFDQAQKAPDGFTYDGGYDFRDSSPRSDQTRAASLSIAMRSLDAIKPVLTSRYLVKGWLDRGTASVVYGESNVGKTFFALDLSLHVAAGRDWHGAKVAAHGKTHPGPVVYIAGEGGTGINNRIEAVRQSDRTLIEAASSDFMLLPTALDLCGDGDAAALIEAIGELYAKPSLVVVDTLARTMGDGDENSAKDMGAFIRNVDMIREALGCHVLIVHHSGKDASKGARGSGSLRAAVDTEIELVRDGEITVAASRKQRDMVTGTTFAYTLRGVSIGFDEDDERVTSAVLEEAEKPTRKTVKRKPMNGTEKTALEALREVIGKHGQKRSGPDYPEHLKVVPVDIWREECDRRGLVDSDNPNSKRATFNRARRSLLNLERTAQFDDMVWLVDDRNKAKQPGTTADHVTGSERNGTEHPFYKRGVPVGSSDMTDVPVPDPTTDYEGEDLNPEDWA